LISGLSVSLSFANGSYAMSSATPPAPALVLYDFTPAAAASDWDVEDDVVMGGVSSSEWMITEDGHGMFKGDVSLDNDGGFASIQRDIDAVAVTGYETVMLRVKGDGKRYQFRLMADVDDRASYITHFETTGDWQVIALPLADFYPVWRGDRLDQPNFPGEQIEQIRFMIANGTAEAFQLEIDWIGLR
jgi:NADH dehydrogenase [ubiquinone] 1 alpha subcomplex assembly factor 1